MVAALVPYFGKRLRIGTPLIQKLLFKLLIDFIRSGDIFFLILSFKFFRCIGPSVVFNLFYHSVWILTIAQYFFVHLFF